MWDLQEVMCSFPCFVASLHLSILAHWPVVTTSVAYLANSSKIVGHLNHLCVPLISFFLKKEKCWPPLVFSIPG